MTGEEHIENLKAIASDMPSDKCADWIESLMAGVKALEQVSSSEKPNKWIACSDKLPEDNTLVLVTVKVRNREPKVRSGYYYMNGHFHIDNGDCWEARDKELIAWMPLPEPYQSEIPTGAERSDKE